MTKTRNKLKIMGLVLTMVLLIASLGVFSLTASAAEATIIAQGECGAEGSSVQWKYDDTGTLTISGSGAMADQFDNYDNRPWETYVDQITTIVVNDGITSIGEAAFWRFQKLTTAKLPDSLTTISQQAFYGCTALKTVNFPANLKTIEGWAFLGCALESVTLPEGLTTIGYRAFSECKNLTSVTVSASVTTIDEGAFGYSPAKITVAEDNLNYSSDEHGVLFDKDKTTLIYCRPNIEVETYTIPSTVTEICKEAFYGCKNLATITIPDGVQRIGSSAFGDCEALTTITIPAGVTTIEANTFYDCTALTAVTIPAGVATIDMWAFSGCTALTTVTIPTSVTSIAYNAFSNCSALTTVNVPCTWDGSLYTFDEGVTVNKVHNWTNGTCTVCGEPCDHKDSTHTAVTDKGDGTHGYACTVCGTAVTEAHTMDITTGKCDECGADMTVVATVTDGTNTYYAADAATLNQAVTAILETGSRTFTVELPADASAEMVTAIRRAICDTEGVADGSINLTLKGVTTIPGTTNWDGVAFGPGDIYDEAGEIVDQELVTQLASINLPDVTEIGAQAFYFCENLVSISAPKAQTIGAQALGYTALTSVEFPELTSIPTDMFSGTWTLSSAKFPKVTTIEQGGLLVGAKFAPENNPTPFPLELTAEGNITFNGSNHFNIASQNYSGKVDLVLCCDKKDAVTFNEDGTATWQVREDLSYTFKSITFKHSYVNGKCTACGEDCTHTGGTATCTTLAVCDTCGVSYGAVDTTNHDSSVECENGFCPNGCYEPATLNAAGYYEIDNAGKLFWFAQQVNVKGNREIKGVLTANIDLENKPWTPIGATGEENNNFRGVFDGQNHTIKGLYVEGGRAGLGFFGEVRTGTVKNFTIYGEVVVNTEVDYVGGVIGSICGVNGETDLERNGAIIQNITSYVNLTAKVHGVGKIGGFVGYANHESLIENCSWYGTFDAGIYRVDDGAGGFIGHIYTNSSVTIRNCAAYGTIKTNYAGDYNNTATIYMGGFLSFSNTGAGTVLENCLFAGKFERGENLTDQAFLGAFGTLRSVNAIKNCYYLGDDGLEAVHSNSDLKPGSDNVEITSVTGEELRNNTIATQLGDHWMQDVHYPIPKDTKAHSDSATYTYTDNGDGTHKATCNECGYEETSRPHTIENHACTDCGAMEIVVSFNAGDYEWKTGDTLYFCRVSRENEWEEYCFTATVAEDGTVTWTPDKTLYWDDTGKHKLVVVYPGDTPWAWDRFYVGDDQTTTEKLHEFDLMNAMWSGNPTTDPITLNLKHRLAKVTVNYEIAEGVTVSKAEVYTLTQYLLFDIHTLERKNIAWEEGHDLWINSYHNGNQFTAFVSPDAYAADGNFIKITLSDGSVREVKMNKAVTFEEGAEYTYKVVITADGAYLTCADECTFEYTDNEDGLTHSKTCSKCGYVAASEAHSGGEATCTEKAICEACGSEYGATDPHSFVDGKCACGIKQFDIYGQQLNIGGDLSMKYYVTALGDGVSTETLKMKFIFLGKETFVSGIYNAEMGMYVFTLEGINPQCMGNKIDAYLILDGKEKASKLSYTVEENLLALREKYKDDTALVTLVNDILAYGSAASEYKGYGSMTDDYVGSNREIPTTNVAPSDAFTGYTVTFGQMNYIKIRVNLADGNTLYLGETDITNELVDGIYKTAGIAPTDFDKVFTFTVKNGDETVATFALSVNDYISAKKDSESMGNLVKALYNYGVSAEVYEHRFTGEGEHVYVETAPNDNQTHKVICVCGHEVTEAHELVDGKCECGVYEITIGNVTAKNFDGTDRVWKSGDTIKVDVWDKDNGGYERTELTYDGTSWGSIITDTKNPVVFAVIGNGDAFANKNSYDIFVYDQQEQSQNVDDYDLMYAYKASINTDAQLDLHFEHLFTKITLNIEYGSEFTETPKIEYVLFVSEPLKPFVTITGINDGNLNFEYAEDWVHPSKFINYGDEADMTDDTVEVIVGIGTLPAGYDFIHFYDRFGTTEPWKKVLVPEGGLTFKDGEEYEFKILITAYGAYIVCNDGCTDFTYTVGENGTHTKTCADCGYEATETHSFDDGVCLCGARLIIDLTQYEVGATIDITQSCIIIGDGTEYNLSLNIAEDVTVVFDEGTGGVKLNAITVADNKTLTLQVKGNVEHIVKEGISIGNGSNVIIEGERDKENNKLTVTATDGNAAIGANNGVTAGDITIRNARVEATGSSTIEEYSESPVSGAAIGTSDANMGDILIENSIITATGSSHSSRSSFAAAIGMGSLCRSIGNMVFIDSEITAKIPDETLASVIGAGSIMHGEKRLVCTMGDIIFTNTSLDLSIVQNLMSYGALIGIGETGSYHTVKMGKIIFTDMTQAELDAMMATWTYPEDFAEWGAYMIGRSPYNMVDENGTIDGVYVSDGNGGTVQVGNADGYNPTGYVTNWGWQ